MPMDTGTVVLQMIGDRNLDLIAPVRLNGLLLVSSRLVNLDQTHTGPGYWPLKTDIGRANPSGAIVTFVISRWYCRGQQV